MVLSLHSVCLRFLSASNLNDFKFDSVSCKSKNEQLDILLCTYRHRRYVKHRVSHRYALAFFKKLLTHIEDNKWEISDDLYEAFGELHSQPYTEQHRNYKLPKLEDVFLTLAESSAFVVDGTTGLRTWQASFLMVEWIAANTHMTNGRKVVELGSGSGLVGLALCVLTNPASCVLTDHHISVMEALKNNRGINEDLLQYKPSLELLDWESVHKSGLTEEQKRIFENTDIILASDVIYDSRIIEPFLTTVKGIMKLSHSGCQVYVASTIRNSATYNPFFTCVSDMGLSVERLTYSLPDDTSFIPDEQASMEIIRIYAMPLTA